MKYQIWGLDIECDSCLYGFRQVEGTATLENTIFVSWPNGKGELPSHLIPVPPASGDSLESNEILAVSHRDWASYTWYGKVRLPHASSQGFVEVDQSAQKMSVYGSGDLHPLGMASFLISPVLPYYLRCEGKLGLHGAVVKIRNKAAIILGDSGLGKSTLALACIRNGLTIMSDDLASLQLRGDACVVQPGASMIRTDVNTSRDVLGDDVSLLSTTAKKYFLDISSDAYWKNPSAADVGAIYVLQPIGDVSHPELRNISKAVALQALYKQISMRNFAVSADVKRNELQMLAGLVDKVPVNTLHRPDGLHHLDATVDLIVQDIERSVA